MKKQLLVKISFGFILSIFFFYLAFRKLNLLEVKHAFALGNYSIVFPLILILFISHYLRSFRWKLLLTPIKLIKQQQLFSALLIGYSANTILPAHLGEIFRALIIGKKYKIPSSSIFATVVVERLIDISSLAFIIIISMFIFSFPTWVCKSSYLMAVVGIIGILLLILLKKHSNSLIVFINFVGRPFPSVFKDLAIRAYHSFMVGIKPLKKKENYVLVIISTFLIWLLYGIIIYFNFYTFDLIEKYNLNLISAIVVLIFTTVSIAIPSSPGYLGTFHWLCQIALSLFGVPKEIGLTYAIVLHAITILPVFIIGLILSLIEGINLVKPESGQINECAKQS